MIFQFMNFNYFHQYQYVVKYAPWFFPPAAAHLAQPALAALVAQRGDLDLAPDDRLQALRERGLRRRFGLGRFTGGTRTRRNSQCKTIRKTGCVLAMALLKRHPIINL